MSGRLSTTRSATFDLVTCRDLLEKLQREISRIEEAAARPDVCDHGTNAAFTAWHLTDWVWADLENNWVTRSAIAKQAGDYPPNFNLGQFQDYVAKKCEDLEICRIIATASKHVGWETPGGHPDVTATGIASGSGGLDATASARSALTLPGGSTVPPESWILKVKIDGKSQDALPIFRNALDYWRSFIDLHQIGTPEEPRK